jgi:stress-induced-phosphoprotein 1
LKDFTEKSYINPELAEEHNAKGGAVFKSGQFPDAIKEYSEAIKRGPSNPKYYCNRATAYMKLMEFP